MFKLKVNNENKLNLCLKLRVNNNIEKKVDCLFNSDIYNI